MNPITPPNTQNMPTDLNSLKQNAFNAAGNVAQLTTDAPSMLQQLKQNLVGIFAKDNPILGARDNALATYLSAPDVARAGNLPQNVGDVPGIEGRPLTLSPSEQNAIVSGRSAAAFAPLAGLNEVIKGQYGTIADLLGNAGDIYKSSIAGAQSNAQNLGDLYKTAVAELQARSQASLNQGLDLPSIIDAITRTLGAKTPTNVPTLDDIFGGHQSGQQQVFTTPEGLKYTVDAQGNPQLYNQGQQNKPVQLGSQPIKIGNITPASNSNPNALTLAGSNPNPYAGLPFSMHL